MKRRQLIATDAELKSAIERMWSLTHVDPLGKRMHVRLVDFEDRVALLVAEGSQCYVDIDDEFFRRLERKYDGSLTTRGADLNFYRFELGKATTCPRCCRKIDGKGCLSCVARVEICEQCGHEELLCRRLVPVEQWPVRP